MISRDIITQPKCHGGLGIRKLDVMNKACLMKLCWGVYSERSPYGVMY